jgi:prepilin-type N-terminal cleavage/methylation domain-containing protein
MKNSIVNKKGFTLIELLVVIAIIGVLSSVVIASLNAARTKAAVSSAKAQLNQIAAQAEVFYQNNNNRYYTSPTGSGFNLMTDCLHTNLSAMVFGDSTIKSMLTELQKNVNYSSGNNFLCMVSGDVQSWFIFVQLRDSTNYCIDSTGTKKAGTYNTTTVSCQ